MSLYAITAQCLTPLGVVNEINRATGIYQQLVDADSLQDAIHAAMQTIALPYRNSRDIAAVLNYDKMTITIMDEKAHIVNYYWGFKGHRA